MNETLVPKEQVTLSPSPTTQQRKERDQKTQRAFKISKSVSRKAFEASKARKLRPNLSSMDNPDAVSTSAVFASQKQHADKSHATANNDTPMVTQKRRRYVQPVGSSKVDLVSKAGAEVKATAAQRGPLIDHSQGKLTIPASKVTKASIEQQRSLG